MARIKQPERADRAAARKRTRHGNDSTRRGGSSEARILKALARRHSAARSQPFRDRRRRPRELDNSPNPLWRKLLRSRAFPWTTSAYVLLITLLLLSKLVIAPPPTTEPLMLLASFTPPEPEPEPTTLDLAAEVEQPEVNAEPEVDPEPQPEQEPEASQTELEPATEPESLPAEPKTPAESPTVAIDQTATEGEVNADAKGGVALSNAASVPAQPTSNAPPHAVRQGNFSVWTVPQVPQAKEPYTIVIEIRLPKRIRKFPETDISGFVMGADGYRKAFGRGATRPRIVDGLARIEIPVVGSHFPTRDAVMIRSRVMRQQKLLVLDYRQ